MYSYNFDENPLSNSRDILHTRICHTQVNAGTNINFNMISGGGDNLAE